MLSKNSGAKKEKLKDSLKKHDRRASQSTKEQQNIAENVTMQPISPRTLVIDFTENTNNSLESEQKLEQTKSFVSIENSKSPRNRFKLPITSNREIVKNVDSARRHASCGPRLMSVVAAAIDDPKNEGNTSKMKQSSEMRCIGNKCGPDAGTDSYNNHIALTKSSPRKTSLDTPRTAASRTRSRLKPINGLSQTNSNNRSDGRTSVARTSVVAPNNIKEYRKYLTQSHLSINKLQSTLPANEHYYNSHFFAVGLSLRAWRSKYSKIRSTRDAQNGGSTNRMIEVKPANSTRKTIKNVQ